MRSKTLLLNLTRVRTQVNQPRQKVDPLEAIGHIPAKEGMTWSCCLCGQTWTTASIKRMTSLGRCPGPSQWTKEPTLGGQIRKKAEGSKLAINGVEIHKSHSLKWCRGVAYCIRCGHYSAGRKVRNLAFQCQLRVTSCTKYRLKRIMANQYPILGGKWPKGVEEERPTFVRPRLTDTLTE